MLTTIDYGAMIAYLLLVLGVAWWTSRKGGEESFLIADRKVGVLGTLASINASKTGANLLIITALLYQFGFSAIWYFIGVGVGYLIFIPFALRIHRYHGKEHYTLADYFFHRYGNFAGKFASIVNIFVMLVILMLNLIASSKVLAFFTGFSFVVSALFVVIFVLIYLLIGGFKAVISTDIIQYGAIVFLFVLFAFVLTQGVNIPATEWNLTAAGGKMVLAFFLLGALFPFASPELWQRVYASKNLRTLKRGILLSVIFYVLVGFLLVLVGLAVKTQLPTIDPDIALIYGFANLLPTGLVGLAVVIFFAAFMSSLDTAAYTASATLIHDFFRGLTKRQIVTHIRFTLFCFVTLMTLLSIALQNLLLGTYIFIGYVVILAVPTIATWIKPKMKSETLNVCFGFGGITLTIVLIQQAFAGTLGPTISLTAIGLSLLGLLLGAIYSRLRT